MPRLALAATTLVLAAALPAQGALDERTRSFYISQTKAGKSQNQGYTGAGVLVAVIDTGVLQSHPEFAGRLRRGKSFTGQGDQSVANDSNGHGTHVAGIIAAARNNSSKGTMGMAYAATILPVKVLKKDGTGTTAMISAGLRFATSKGAPIVNMSLGADSAFDASAFQEAVAAGQLIVAAAGNSGLANPGWPARYAGAAWAQGQIIAVGAVDANNQIANFSNRAGDTAAFYIVAPGVGIRSTHLGNGYARLSGTSMAAPVVTGAAAMIKGRWSYLSAQQIATLLFTTATDLGDPGVDAIYGHGLLNVAAAMAPVGGLVSPSSSGATVNVATSALKTTPATAGWVTLARQGKLQLVAFDGFGRDFAVDLGAATARPRDDAMASAQAGHDRLLRQAETRLADGARLQVVHARRTQVAAADPSAARVTADRLVGLGYTSVDGPVRHFMGLGLAEQQFGLAADGTGRALRGVPGLADPYLGLLPQAAYAGLDLAWADGRLRVGALDTGLRGALLDQDGPTAGDAAAARAAVLEFSRPAGDRLTLLGRYSRTLEQDTTLGALGHGALALGDGARTDALGVGVAWQPAEGWTLGLRQDWGRTAGHRDADHLIREVSEQRTMGWALAVASQDRWLAGDRVSVTLAQPLRTESGSMMLDAVQAVDAAGQPLRQAQRLSLVPDGRERRLTLSYGRPLALDGLGGERIAGWLDLSLVLRHQADHQAGAPADAGLMLRWQAAF